MATTPATDRSPTPPGAVARTRAMLAPSTPAELNPSEWHCHECGAFTDSITRDLCERCRVLGGLLDPDEVVDPDLRAAMGLPRDAAGGAR